MEFSRIVLTEHLAPAGLTTQIEAEPAECEAVARRLGLVSLEHFSASLTLRPVHGGLAVCVAGTLRATVVQYCVVNLEPVVANIEESFTLLYAAPTQQGAVAEVLVGLGDGESPEPLFEDQIDIGEAVTQQLSLELDPYPRHPDAALSPDATAAGDVAVSERDNPFAALTALKKD